MPLEPSQSKNKVDEPILLLLIITRAGIVKALKDKFASRLNAIRTSENPPTISLKWNSIAVQVESRVVDRVAL